MMVCKNRRIMAAGIVSVILAGILAGLAYFPYIWHEQSTNITQEPPAKEAPAAAEPLTKGIRVYTVLAGDTLSSIASHYNIDVESLYGANPQINERIYPGNQLVILPGKGVLYTVSAGDTLWGISRYYNVDSTVIEKANGKVEPDVFIGERLFIPGGRVTHFRREATPSRAGNSRFLWPVQGTITSGFGLRWGRLHAGIDIANEAGTPVRAALAGRSSFVGWCSGYGNAVIIDHQYGYTTLYGHLAECLVSQGEYVSAGQVIGYMGSTGNSTGPHLHFEVRKDELPINPTTVLP